MVYPGEVTHSTYGIDEVECNGINFLKELCLSLPVQILPAEHTAQAPTQSMLMS